MLAVARDASDVSQSDADNAQQRIGKRRRGLAMPAPGTSATVTTSAALI